MASQDSHGNLLTSDNYRYNNAQYPKSVLERLNALRDDDVFCDVIIRIGEQTFPAHKCVLAAFSPYFEAMFTSQLKESRDREVTLKDIEPSTLETLLQFAYTGDVNITPENVQSLIVSSNLLQVLSVRDACSLFMEKRIDASNCLGVYGLAESLNCEKLQEVAKEFALSNFKDLSGHEEFLSLSLDKLVELVRSDELNVPREEDVYAAALKWFNHQPEAREKGFHEVLGSVRLPLLSPYFLHDCVSKEEIVRTSPQCQALLEEARLFHLLPDRRGAMHGIRTQPRSNAKLVDVVVCTGGIGVRSNPDHYDRYDYHRQRYYDQSGHVEACVEAFNQFSNGWESLPNLPFSVYGHGAVVTGKNVLYIAGGLDSGDSISKRLLRYDPQNNKWEERASMSVARYNFGMAVLDGFIYAVGANDGRQPDMVERYDTETNKWEQLLALGAGITSPAVIAHDGYLYVAGGSAGGNGEGSTRVQRFDPRTLEWADMAPMLSPRSGSAGCVFDGKLYIIGGQKGNTGATNEVECYDIHKNQWSPCSAMGVMRNHPGVAVMEGHIYVLGGKERGGAVCSSVERYTPSVDRWDEATEMKIASPRHSLKCCVLKIRR